MEVEFHEAVGSVSDIKDRSLLYALSACWAVCGLCAGSFTGGKCTTRLSGWNGL